MSGTAAADLECDGGGFLRGLEREMRSRPYWWGESGGVSVFVIYYSHEKVT